MLENYNIPDDQTELNPNQIFKELIDNNNTQEFAASLEKFYKICKINEKIDSKDSDDNMRLVLLSIAKTNPDYIMNKVLSSKLFFYTYNNNPDDHANIQAKKLYDNLKLIQNRLKEKDNFFAFAKRIFTTQDQVEMEEKIDNIIFSFSNGPISYQRKKDLLDMMTLTSIQINESSDSTKLDMEIRTDKAVELSEEVNKLIDAVCKSEDISIKDDVFCNLILLNIQIYSNHNDETNEANLKSLKIQLNNHNEKIILVNLLAYVDAYDTIFFHSEPIKKFKEIFFEPQFLISENGMAEKQFSASSTATNFLNIANAIATFTGHMGDNHNNVLIKVKSIFIEYLNYIEVHRSIDDDLSQKITKISDIVTLLSTYLLSLENADQTSQIYKDRMKLFALKCSEANVFMDQLRIKSKAIYDPERFVNFIKVATNAVNNLNNLNNKVRDSEVNIAFRKARVANFSHANDPGRQLSELITPQVKEVCNQGYILASKLIKGSRTEDLKLLATSAQYTKEVLLNPIDQNCRKKLSKSVVKAERQRGFKRYALSIAAVILGSLMVVVGVTTILFSSFLTSVTLPTIIGPIVGGLGIAGGVSFFVGGVGMVTAGAEGIRLFKTAPMKGFIKAKKNLLETAKLKKAEAEKPLRSPVMNPTNDTIPVQRESEPLESSLDSGAGLLRK